MPNDMGTFRVDIELENPARPGHKRTLRSVLVDTGAELSWVPAEVLESLGVERCGAAGNQEPPDQPVMPLGRLDAAAKLREIWS